MKAIHNTYRFIRMRPDVGNYKLKYNFESNSQHVTPYGGALTRW
nr:hypothetical protein [Flavobacterium psychrophilum]